MGAVRLPSILEKISVSTECNEKEMMIAAGPGKSKTRC